MNTKGQLGLGSLIMTAVAIIVGITLLIGTGGIAANSAKLTTLQTADTKLVACVDGTTTTLSGQAVSNFVATNSSSGGALPATNYTLNNRVLLTDGTLGATVTWKAGALTNAGSTANLTYTYEPLGYAPDSASRSIIGIVVILVCLGIGVIALSPILKDKVLNTIGG